MSWTENKPIKFKLGAVALWNFLHKKIVMGNDPTLELLKRTNQEAFDEFVSQEK